MMIDYKKELNAEQYTAVTQTEGPLLILAVAGSGKTRTLVYRVAYLIEHGVDPHSILLLTFTNKAAKEMCDRASAIAGDACGKITACTYHAFCVRTLRQYAHVVGLENDFQVLSSSEAEDVIDICMDKLDYKHRGFPRKGAIQGAISASINKGILLPILLQQKRYEKLFPYAHEICEIRDEYNEYKKLHNQVDFDDLLLKMVELLEVSPSARQALENRYQYIMVDEYQDSNALQEKMLFLLREHNHNLAVVGDDMQSLYGFRGAEAGNIIHFPDKMKGCKVVTLRYNYRSTQQILDLGNVIQKNTIHGIPKQMISWNNRQGPLPKKVYAWNDKQEASYIVNEIKNLIGSRRHPEDPNDWTRVKCSDIAVLERSASSSNQLEMKLQTEGIPFVKFGGLKFMDRSYVRDVMAIWKTLINEKDELSWYRVLHLFEGIADKYARKLSAMSGLVGSELLTNNLFQSHKFAKDLRKYADFYTKWKGYSLETVIPATFSWYEDQRAAVIMNSKKLTVEQKEDQIDNLKEDMKSLHVFIDMLEDYKTLAEFVEAITLDAVNKDDDGDHVVISTIHSSKGLEYPYAYILDCADGVFPRSKPGTSEDDEELRCMYVAVTRAQDELTVMVPRMARSYSGSMEPVNESHFLQGTDRFCDVKVLNN